MKALRTVGRARALLGTAALVAAILSLVVASAALAGTTLTVCATGCAYSTIQSAIDAASDGDTVAVQPGRYAEQLRVAKSLTIVGSGAGQTVIAPTSLAADTSGLRTILTIGGSQAVTTDVSGLTLQGPAPEINAGILVRDEATLNLHDSALKDIRESATLSGAQRGIAIYVGRQALSTTGHATIARTVITGYQKGGIVVDNSGSSAVITGNTVTGDGSTTVTAQNGIQVSRGATASISGNTISANDYTPTSNIGTGILLYQAGLVGIGANTVNADEIGLYTNTQSALSALDLASFSGSGNGRLAVADTTGWPVPATTHADLTLASAVSDDNGADIVATGGGAHVIGFDAFAGVQPAVDAVVAGGTVDVSGGTYTANLAIGKSITLEGHGQAATIVGSMTVSAPDVTVDGFILTNPSGTNAVTVASVSNVHITGNTIRDIGGAGTTVNASGAVQALYVYNNGASDVSGLVISGNTISHVRSSGAGSGTSVKAIFIGNLNDAKNIAATISNNTLSDVVSGGWGAYGILVDHGATSVGTSSVDIEGNTISGLSGGYVHAIGLEGDTPGATVIANSVAGLTDTDTPGNPDAAAVTLEDNPHAAGAIVARNSFGAGGVVVASTATGPVNVTSNWWGSAATGPVGRTVGSVVSSPWCTDPSCATRSDNADLAALSLSAGALSFSPATANYSLDVTNAISVVSVGVVAGPGATAVVSGAGSLGVGPNSITVRVVSADGSATRTYTIAVNRAAAAVQTPPAAAPATTATATVTPAPAVVNEPVSAAGTPGASGALSVSVEAPAPTAGVAQAPPVSIGLSWPSAAFLEPVTVLVTPMLPASVATVPGTAPAPTGTLLAVAGGFSLGATAVQVNVTNAAGVAITQFAAPLVIHVSASSAGDVPAYSHDGTVWTTIPRLGTPELPVGQQDGYFTNSDGSIDIYTRHATYFAVLADTQAPTAPRVSAQMWGGMLRLSWAGIRDNIGVSGYVISLDGRGYKASKRTTVVVSPRVGRYSVIALDAAGNKSKPSTTITLVGKNRHLQIAH